MPKRRLLLPLVLPAVAGFTPLPDLAVRRDGFERTGDRVAFVIENRGSAPSPASEAELWDRPPLPGPTGTSSPYPRVANRREIWFRQAPAAADTIALDIELGSALGLGPPSGEVRLLRRTGIGLANPGPGIEVDPPGSRVSWDGALLGPDAIVRLRVPGQVGSPPTVVFRVETAKERLPILHFADGETKAALQILELDCLDRDAARRQRVSVPPLAGGERVRLEAEFPGGVFAETFVVVDPDDQLLEVRKGNNTSSIRSDAAERTLAALHVHSSFSEGAGSVDSQVFMAARSGYDFLWWTEHDWRIESLNHLTRHGFEPDEEGVRAPDGRNSSGDVSLVIDEPYSGQTSLRLAVAEPGPGIATFDLRSPRRSMSYSLAADVTLEVGLRARDLDPGDVFTIVVTLSRHDRGMRQLLYEFRRPGDVPPPPAVRPPGIVRIPRELPGGDWIRATLPISRDAASAWENGLDDSLFDLEMRLDCRAGGGEIRLDDFRIDHRLGGDALRRVQIEWMEDYPNVAHGFGEEISWRQPHLNQYGAPREWVDYERVWEAVDVEAAVERIHRGGGLIAWCHPYGVAEDLDSVAHFDAAYFDSILARALGGVDILEVGFRQRARTELSKYLGLWDDASRRGVRIVGIGVNDSHEDMWGPWENNFGTWIAAPADERALLEVLAEGNVTFGDPLAFRGRLDIRAGESHAGETISGASPRTVEVSIAGAPPGARVRLAIDGATREEWPVIGDSGAWEVFVPAGTARSVRAEVWGDGDRPLAFTNPLWFRGVD